MAFRGCSVLVLTALAVQASLPCAGVYRKSKADGLEAAQIASEQAVIIWESESKTETFIRTAKFDGQGADFGFIVPTPSEPELSEAPSALYSVLSVIHRKRYPLPIAAPSRGTGGFGGGAGGGGGQVEIVKEQVVSGLKATVLKASDTEALQLWLTNNEYVATPEVMRWVEAYVENGFYLTAFKIDRKPGSEHLKSATVKMVFKSKVPFYPYREPDAPKSSKARSLEVYFIAPWLAKARYTDSQKPWEVQTNDVPDLSESEIKQIMDTGKMAPETMPADAKLTYFLDKSRNRADHDVLFQPVKTGQP